MNIFGYFLMFLRWPRYWRNPWHLFWHNTALGIVLYDMGAFFQLWQPHYGRKSWANERYGGAPIRHDSALVSIYWSRGFLHALLRRIFRERTRRAKSF